MPPRRRRYESLDVRRPLRAALVKLKAERERIDNQIDGIQRALSVLSGEPQAKKGGPAIRRRTRRPAMSAKTRQALSRRMKAYWAKRKAAAAKEKAKGQAMHRIARASTND